MQYLDLSLSNPAENLALDELLLEQAEASESPREIIRFWESQQVFVVLGAGGKLQEEVRIDACQEDGIQALRRCSGGGTVVQGPGCLNYTLVLDQKKRPEVTTIKGTNAYILARTQLALSGWISGIEVAGVSDLCISGRKFSGSAQKRKPRCVLFHASILYGFNLDVIGRYLHEPARQPDYRATRRHSDFVCNLQVDPATIKRCIQRIWGAEEPCMNEQQGWPDQQWQVRLMAKYGDELQAALRA